MTTAKVAKGVTSRVQQITPRVAVEMLERNTINRPTNRHHIQKFANDMTEGRWMLNGQSISFDNNGDLVDGQHRLMGVVKSGVTVPMLVVRGIDPEARPTVDIGRRRTVANELAMRGESNTVSLAATLMTVRRLTSTEGTGYPVILTSLDAIEMLEEHPEIREAVAFGEHMRSYLQMPASAIAYCRWAFDAVDADDSKRFWEAIETGAYQSNDPRYALQRTVARLASESTFSATTFAGKKHLIALTTQAWNAFRENRQLTRLTYKKASGSFPQPR